MCTPLTHSFVPRQTSHLAVFFPVPRDPIQAFPDGKHFPLRTPFGSPAQHSLLNWDMLDSPLAFLQQEPDSGAQVPQQFLKALQGCCFPLWVLSSRAGKDKISLSEFVGIPAPVCGSMGSRDRKAGSLQASGYSYTQRVLKGLVRWTLFNSSSLDGPSGTPRNLKLNSGPYFN